jgi:single-stranded DNA-binding protein
VTVHGELRTFTYKGEDGNTRHGFEIVAQDIERATFLPKANTDKMELSDVGLPDFSEFEAQSFDTKKSNILPKKSISSPSVSSTLK